MTAVQNVYVLSLSLTGGRRHDPGMTHTALTRDAVLMSQHALTDTELRDLLAAERRYEPDCDDDEIQLRSHP